MSLRDQILAAEDLNSETMDIPAWGVKIGIRSMSARARTKTFHEALGKDGTLDMAVLYPLLIVECVFDPETGEPVFTAEDIPALLEKHGVVVQTVAQKALTLSAMDKDAVDEAVKD